MNAFKRPNQTLEDVTVGLGDFSKNCFYVIYRSNDDLITEIIANIKKDSYLCGEASWYNISSD